MDDELTGLLAEASHFRRQAKGTPDWTRARAREKKILEWVDAVKQARVLSEAELAAAYNDGARDLREAADSLAKASTPEPFSTSKTSNWVARGGGLPAYIQHIAHDLMEKRGKTESNAIQMAIGIVKRWAKGVGNVDPGTRAAAAKAVAEWEALKAKAKAKKVAEAAGMIKCAKCGTMNTPGSKKCRKCGAPLEEKGEPGPDNEVMEGFGGVVGKFTAALHPRGRGGQFVDAPNLPQPVVTSLMNRGVRNEDVKKAKADGLKDADIAKVASLNAGYTTGGAERKATLSNGVVVKRNSRGWQFGYRPGEDVGMDQAEPGSLGLVLTSAAKNGKNGGGNGGGPSEKQITSFDKRSDRPDKPGTKFGSDMNPVPKKSMGLDTSKADKAASDRLTSGGRSKSPPTSKPPTGKRPGGTLPDTSARKARRRSAELLAQDADKKQREKARRRMSGGTSSWA